MILAEIIEKLNELFIGDLTDDDKVIYVGNVIKGKLLESKRLQQQAVSNSKEQFKTSPDLMIESNNAYMDSLDAHPTMSKQAIQDPYVNSQVRKVLHEQ